MDNRRWPVSEIVKYLNQLAALQTASRAYATFSLQHGHEWKSQMRPIDVKEGVPKGCFGNSQRILFREGRSKGLTYVEGYACSGSLNFPLSIHHAWLVDQQGNVIDPTWEDSDTSTYFGVPFSYEYVVNTIREAREHCSLLDNFHNRWSLLSTPEIAEMAVEKSVGNSVS